MYYRFVGPYGSQPNERDATDFSEEVHDFFAEARAGVHQDEKQKARLHALLQLDMWYRQLACVAIADSLNPREEQTDPPLVEEFRVALLEFPDVTPEMLTPRVLPEKMMQMFRDNKATLQDLIRDPAPLRPRDEFLFRVHETIYDSIDGKSLSIPCWRTSETNVPSSTISRTSAQTRREARECVGCKS